MSSVIRSTLVGTGNAADYVDQIKGPIAYYKDLGTEMRASTTTRATIMLALSAVYDDLSAVGFGTYNTNVCIPVNQFFIGLSSGVNGTTYKAPALLPGIMDYNNSWSDLITSNRVLGFLFAPRDSTVHNYALTDGTNNGLVDFTCRTAAVADNVTATLTNSIRTGGNADSQIIIPAQKYGTYNSKLIANTLTLEVTTSGQIVTMKLRRDSTGGVTEYDNAAALASSMAANIGAPTHTQIDVTTLYISGMTAAQYVQAHPYFFIQWPLTGISLNLHHCHTLVSP
jgi:hypothetical protein